MDLDAAGRQPRAEQDFLTDRFASQTLRARDSSMNQAPGCRAVCTLRARPLGGASLPRESDIPEVVSVQRSSQQPGKRPAGLPGLYGTQASIHSADPPLRRSHPRPRVQSLWAQAGRNDNSHRDPK